MQKDRNTFIKSSGVRLSVRIAFLSLLFWSFDFHVVQSHDGQPLTGINFCSDKRNKGRRLNSTVYDNRHAMSQIDCVVQCVYEECCRATNYRKRDSFNGNENCELLHAVASEQPEDLIEVEDYDYTLLLEPEKSFDCRCFSCMHNGICESSTKSCLCVPGFTGKQCEKVARKSCDDLHNNGVKSDGVYTIDPDGQGAFDVRCDMTTDGGGWTVFQRRMDGSEDFFRNWADYKTGFGDLNGEFWLGLEKISRLSESGQDVLRVDLEDFENEKRFAKYDTFAMTDESDQYMLTSEDYSGDAGDSLAGHNGMKFTTKDMDNDQYQSNCAWKYKGAWWYRRCHTSNLNGLYLRGAHELYGQGVQWRSWKGHHYSLQRTEMKIRPSEL